MINLKLDGSQLKTLYGISNKINDNINIFVENKKTVFQTISQNNTVLFEMKIESKNKDKTNCSIPIKKISNIVSILNNKDNVIIELPKDYVRFKFKGMERNIRILGLKDDLIKFNFPNERKKEPLKFKTKIKVFSSEIKNTIKATKDMGTNLFFDVNKESLTLYKDDKTDDFKNKISGNNIKIEKYQKKFDSKYNSELLEPLFNNIEGAITIEFNENHPIFIKSNIDYAELKYMVAPIVKELDQ